MLGSDYAMMARRPVTWEGVFGECNEIASRIVASQQFRRSARRHRSRAQLLTSGAYKSKQAGQ
jgi:hypothetical protein